MTDLISPRARKIAGLIVTVAVGVLALAMEWSDLGPEFTLWSRRAFAILVVVSNAFGLSVTLPKVRAAGAAVMMIVLAMVVIMASACTPGIAWRTLDAVQHARTLTAQQLAAVGHVKHRACLATHGAGTDGYRVCIEPTRAMLRHWQREARPAILAAVQITASSLQIAEKVKSDKAVKWLELIKPAVCALARVVKLFKSYLPDGGASILSVVAMAEGVTCGR